MNIVEMAPKLSIHNRNKIKPDTDCGCYFCLRTFKGRDITEWCDVSRIKWLFIFWKMQSMTALCPNCGMDTVIPEIDKGILTKAYERWFCGYTNENE